MYNIKLHYNAFYIKTSICKMRLDVYSQITWTNRGFFQIQVSQANWQ